MADASSIELYVREQIELRRLAGSHLGGNRVVAFACASPEVREVARNFLTGSCNVEFTAFAEARDGSSMLDALDAVAASRLDAFSWVVLDGTNAGAVEMLNLHREKLRRGGSVLLWLGGDDTLRTVRSLAPDAFSFRDALIVLEGDLPISVEAERRDSLTTLFYRNVVLGIDEPRLPIALLQLANALREQGSLDEAHEVASRALKLVPAAPAGSEDRELIGGLAFILAYVEEWRGKAAQAAEWIRRGLAATAGNRDALALELTLKALVWPPGGVIDQALPELAISLPAIPRERRLSAINALRTSAQNRGDLETVWGLADLAAPEHAPSVGIRSAAAEVARGRLRPGQARADGTALPFAEQPLALTAWSLLEQGELHAAEKRARAVLEREHEHLRLYVDVYRVLAEAALSRGDVESALDLWIGELGRAREEGRDGMLADAAMGLVRVAEGAWSARRLEPAREKEVDLAIERALGALPTNGVLASAYAVFTSTVRGRLFLGTGRAARALVQASRAYETAVAEWADDIAPSSALRAHALVSQGNFEQVLFRLPEDEAQARRARHFLALCALQKCHVLALAKTCAPVGVVRAKLAVLRETLTASRSPSLEARQLFDLGRSLPPESDALDALTLLDEARAISVELPWPFQQARCDECAGDVLRARGQREEAVRRYDAALRTCRDYGLLLRMPCIEASVTECAAAPASAMQGIEQTQSDD